MTDELSNLKALMDEATPRPDTQRRQDNLSRASANFARLHAPKDAKPAGFWSRSKLWLGGTAASLAVVATALVLFVSLSTPVPLGPITTEMNDVLPEPASDFAIATQEAPQALASTTAAPAARTIARATPSPEAAELLADASLSYQRISQILRGGQLPDPADVQVSAMLSGVAESLLMDTGPVTSLPTPWNNSTHLVVVALPSSNGNAGARPDGSWRLLGTGQQDTNAIAVYQAPIAAGEPAREVTYFAAAVTGFALLLSGDTSVGGWSFDDAIALAQRGVSDDPVRLEMLDLMERAQALSR